ncbi:MAG TPA: hypothetical protein EYG85_05270 [Crocinitomix sp.]|nr:hypothetical protein [Crocinitomix sp.]
MKICFKLLLVFFPLLGISQNEEDALRYSQTFFGGTARNLSMGGALTALGGDFSTTSQNPASMAQFNKGNFSLTPLIETSLNNADFYGQTIPSTNSTIKIGNVSYLKSYDLTQLPNYKGWARLQLGIGYNRINTFDNYREYSGNIDNSILNSFINDANGTPTSDIYSAFPFTAGLAYDVYAIDPESTSTENLYTTTYKGEANHTRVINTKGGIGEYSFLASANYKNKLYIGGSVNYNVVKYDISFTHKETYELADSIWLNDITYSGYINTEGTGFNVKIGAIYLVNESLRFGFGFHSPTYYQLKDFWGNDMKASTDDPSFPLKYIAAENKPTGEYDYRLVTPLKVNFSSGYTFNNKGCIGIELEYVDFSTSVLKQAKQAISPYSFNVENQQIKNIYTNSINLKVGGEYKINPRLAVRGGYALYHTPYSKNSQVNVKSNHFITGGLGLNFGDYYFDFAGVFNRTAYEYFAYNPDIEGSKVFFKENNFRFSVTLGFRI